MNTRIQAKPKMRGDYDVSYLNQSIDTMISQFMQEEKIDGLTLAIVQAPYIPRTAGYGVSDRIQGRLASVNTMWPIGAISQAFAAVAVMQLHELNKLNIEDPVRTYITELPETWKSIKILDLLHHASGLPDYRNHKNFCSNCSWSFAQLLDLIKTEKLHFVSGTAIKQSATNFLLLSEVVERVGKISYQDFIKKNQIDYLGLKHTGFVEDLEKFPHEDVSLSENIHQLFKKDLLYIDPVEPAVSYDEEDQQIPTVNSSAMRGFGDIWATAQDVSFWDIALAGSILIHDAENRKKIYAPWTLPDGKEVPAVAGWQFYKHHGLMDIKGSMQGYSSFLSRFTDAKELVCVTLLANKEGIDFTNLGRRIAACFGDLLSTGSNDNHHYVMESQFSVKQTIQRLEDELKTRDIPVFAKFDHAKNAADAGLTLRATTVLVFGSPKVGTLLMQENQSISMELPLRISIWEDKSGSVWLGFPKISKMAESYQLENHEIISNMQKLLERLAYCAGNIY